MKKEIHPKNYRPVLFKDTAGGYSFVVRSCAPASETAVWEEDGQEYPVCYLGVSSHSHPFYTGQQKFLDTAGRVDKFQQRMAKTKAMQEAAAQKKKKRRK